MDGFTTRPIASVTQGRTSATLTSVKAWLLGVAAAAAAGMSRAAINRRVVRQLSVMSDRELRDIGLVRQDVLDSELLLLEGDASSFLVGRRNERRAGRRVPRGQWPPRRA
ncbi:hypothetical protein ASF49_07745 [Methylobacterium sp. Leaf104]|uniref:DUF1127 domain-containing protein n=1 Tax=Methylobacterium TaxID=407 RepID=UPI0007005602|nr:MULTISPECIES: DUF1127 domain-containing protein [Methylobacterium]KQP33753.1 hypothetical protein ASF49_07745 [Methylobacterium sp. Leaf104]MCI9879685.1 DUF1127 domain-containing protein [Methylobacterium goesingense]